MYIKQTIQETYDLITKNKTNLILYALLQIAFIIALLVIMVGSLIIGGIIGGTAIADIIHALSSQSFAISDAVSDSDIVALILEIAFYIIILIIFSIFMSLTLIRLIYLTSKGTVIPITMASVSTLINYAKTNFIQCFKLLFTIIILVFFVSLAFSAVFILAFSFDLFTTKVIPILLFVFTLLLSIILLYVIYVATTLFFMGNENIGSIKLLRAGWRLCISNLIEFVLFSLAVAIIYICFVILVVILSILPCCGLILIYIIDCIYLFAMGVAWFIFIAHLVEKQQKTATSTII
ncbi:MAG: hypothetical protein AB1391_01730 [Candidatus Micrarchaeota archaeon]